MPKLTPHQKHEYLEKAKHFTENNPSVFHELIGTLGPKGKLKESFPLFKEYNSIELGEFPGLDEDFVTAVLIGAMINPKKTGMDYLLHTGSSPDNRNPLGSNQNFVVDNVPRSDARARFIGPQVVQARNEAKQALQEYAAGKPEKAKKMLQEFLDFNARNFYSMKVIDTRGDKLDLAFSSHKASVSLASKLSGTEPFMLEPNTTPIQKAKMKAFELQQKAVYDAGVIKQNLINGTIVSEEEKKTAAADLVFNLYISNISRAMADKNDEAVKQIFADFCSRIGAPDPLSEDDFTYYDISNSNGLISDAEADLREEYFFNHISKLEAVLASPGGIDKLRRLYMPKIKKSPEYEAIVNAGTEDEMVDAIHDAEEKCAVDITEKFPTVKLTDLATSMNKAQFKNLTAVMAEKKNVFEEGFADFIKRNNSDHQYYMHSLTPEELTVNAQHLEAFTQHLKNVNKRGGSRNFTDLYEAMKKLRDFGKKLAEQGRTPTAAEMQEYVNLGKTVNDLASNYLDNKTNINSDYARNRVNVVKRFKSFLNLHVLSAEELAKSRLKEEMGAAYQAYEKIIQYNPLDNPEAGKAFQTKVFRPRTVMPSAAHGYTIGRSGHYSITIMALAATGKYSLDDLIDPKKFVAEKSAMLDTVMEKIVYGRKEDQQWIAENLVRGMDVVTKMTDEAMQKLDFNDPKVFSSDAFHKITAMGFYRFDAWQEIDHCKVEITEAAKAVYPGIESYNDIYNKLRKDIGTITDYVEFKSQSLTAAKEFYQDCFDYSEQQQKVFMGVEEILMGSLKAHISSLAITEKMKTADGKPFSELFTREEPIILNNLAMDFMQSYGEKAVDAIVRHPELLKENMDKIANGEFFKDVKLVYHKELAGTPEAFEISGGPELVTKVQTQSFMVDAEEAIKRLETKTYKNKEEYYHDSAYAITGGIYKVTGNLPFKSDTKEKTSLRAFANHHIKNEAFRNSLARAEGGKLKNPKNVAAFVKNPDKIMDMLRYHKEKENRRRAQPKVLQENAQTRPRSKAVVGKSTGTVKKTTETKITGPKPGGGK